MRLLFPAPSLEMQSLREELARLHERTQTKTALHLHAFDVSKPGVRLFLAKVANKPELLQECLDTANRILYDPALRKEWDHVDTLRTTHQPWSQSVPRSVTIIVRSMDGVAFTTGKVLDDDHKEIHVSAEYIESLLKRRRRKSQSSNAKPTPTKAAVFSAASTAVPESPNHKDSFAEEQRGSPIDIEAEIRGFLVHELVHCIQTNGKGTCPGGLIEGIADWVRLRAGLAPPHWKPYPGRGNDDDEDDGNSSDEDISWDAGYDKTAYFLAWLEKRLDVSHLVPRLNQALASHKWHEGKAFSHAAKQDVDLDDLWSEYCKGIPRKACN